MARSARPRGAITGGYAMNELDDAHADLAAALAVLRTQWRSTREAWRDPVGDRFEQDSWGPVEEQSISYLAAIRALENVLDDAEQNTR